MASDSKPQKKPLPLLGGIIRYHTVKKSDKSKDSD